MYKVQPWRTHADCITMITHVCRHISLRGQSKNQHHLIHQCHNISTHSHLTEVHDQNHIWRYVPLLVHRSVGIGTIPVKLSTACLRINSFSTYRWHKTDIEPQMKSVCSACNNSWTFCFIVSPFIRKYSRVLCISTISNCNSSIPEQRSGLIKTCQQNHGHANILHRRTNWSYRTANSYLTTGFMSIRMEGGNREMNLF